MTMTLLVGTNKGAFLLDSTRDRKTFEVRGPFCDGWSINQMTGDPETGMIWAAGGGEWSGSGVFRSADGGKTWKLKKLSKGMTDDWAANDPEFAKMIGWTPEERPFDGEIDSLWSINRVGDKLYAGGKPAQLYVSGDDGETWERNAALKDFPERDGWNPGAAGLVLHTILPSPDDPKKLWLGISAVGVFATEDGGATWEIRNRLTNESARAHADHHDHHNDPTSPSSGETGQCVHNIGRAPGAGDLLYQQNHHGVYRSRDGGRSWDDVTEGLPSNFGFPIGTHPRDPDTVWTLPLNGDMAGRYPPDAKAAVWKTTDGGETWRACREGLPQEACFFTVLRQAMTVDGGSPAGIYFGTNSGSVFASDDEGETWTEAARHLPTILSVDLLEKS